MLREEKALTQARTGWKIREKLSHDFNKHTRNGGKFLFGEKEKLFMLHVSKWSCWTLFCAVE